MSNWINVNDEYPNKSGDYLVCVSEGGFNATRKVLLKRFTDRDIARGEVKISDWVELTNWMPLPEPPND